MSSVTVDLSALAKLQELLEDSDKETLQVGWFSSANYNDSLSVAQVAFWQEFGTKSAPPRPFFRPAVTDNKDKWAALVDSGLTAVTEGRASINDVLNGLGLTAQADVMNAIAGQHAALSPVTLAIRKLKHDGQVINGTLVGAVAAAIARGETGPGQLGEPFANNTPLQDSKLMITSLTYNVGEAQE